jgi:hypothetical protein
MIQLLFEVEKLKKSIDEKKFFEKIMSQMLI